MSKLDWRKAGYVNADPARVLSVDHERTIPPSQAKKLSARKLAKAKAKRSADARERRAAAKLLQSERLREDEEHEVARKAFFERQQAALNRKNAKRRQRVELFANIQMRGNELSQKLLGALNSKKD